MTPKLEEIVKITDAFFPTRELASWFREQLYDPRSSLSFESQLVIYGSVFFSIRKFREQELSYQTRYH